MINKKKLIKLILEFGIIIFVIFFLPINLIHAPQIRLIFPKNVEESMGNVAENSICVSGKYLQDVNEVYVNHVLLNEECYTINDSDIYIPMQKEFFESDGKIVVQVVAKYGFWFCKKSNSVDIMVTTEEAVENTEVSEDGDQMKQYDIPIGVSNEENMLKYLEYLKQYEGDYVIVFAADDEASGALTENIIAAMRKLGLEFNMANKYRNSYIAVIDEEDVIYEENSTEDLFYEYNVENNLISVVSAGYQEYDGNKHYSTGHIYVNGVNYAVGTRGLNIVVYDKDQKKVIDSVVFDTCENIIMGRLE